jgi:hypothetical protein
MRKKALLALLFFSKYLICMQIDEQLKDPILHYALFSIAIQNAHDAYDKVANQQRIINDSIHEDNNARLALYIVHGHTKAPFRKTKSDTTLCIDKDCTYGEKKVEAHFSAFYTTILNFSLVCKTFKKWCNKTHVLSNYIKQHNEALQQLSRSLILRTQSRKYSEKEITEAKQKIRILVTHGCTLDIRHNCQEFMCSISQHPHYVETKNGRPEIFYIDEPTFWTPLHWAAFAGSPDIIELLVQHGASVHATDNAGATPLHIAAADPYFDYDHDENERIRYITSHTLLELGANPTAQDINGKTPLDYTRYIRVHNLLQPYIKERKQHD